LEERAGERRPFRRVPGPLSANPRVIIDSYNVLPPD
jgi:hypothetical protein